MSYPITVAIAGLGSRGKDTYAPLAKKFPDKMKITAIADIVPEKVAEVQRLYDVPAERCFSSAEEMLKQERLADVMFICTQDRQHVGHAIPALEKGYHLVLEKPISPDDAECRAILRAAEQAGRQVIVCHVLRYTPFYNKLKELVDSGVVGEVVAVQAVENVGYWHQAHSFVRGNWRNAEQSSPMILQKCCHDMDILLWLTGKKCRSVSSVGNTYLFRPEKAPAGAALRCLDGCAAKDSCPYDAEKIYITNPATGVSHGHTGWPCDVLTLHPTVESVTEALRTGPYGRCVYHCDNTVVDHQAVNLDMEDGSVISFLMCGFTSEVSRRTKIMGTKGEIIGEMGQNIITVRPFGQEPQVIDVSKLTDDFSGHGGGDSRMVEEFLDQLALGSAPSLRTTSLERSTESHYIAFAAEQSRLQGGAPVLLSSLR
ncbi:MAG: Gfo/Idh/MocA family oxidoreductase [Oscillospiraceae bacterium]|jgi:predicted dehydrogenase|nr:Gfo/Idh/MocA family oxidoreductase [Oscillospiraceae bacterium]